MLQLRHTAVFPSLISGCESTQKGLGIVSELRQALHWTGLWRALWLRVNKLARSGFIGNFLCASTPRTGTDWLFPRPYSSWTCCRIYNSRYFSRSVLVHLQHPGHVIYRGDLLKPEVEEEAICTCRAQDWRSRKRETWDATAQPWVRSRLRVQHVQIERSFKYSRLLSAFDGKPCAPGSGLILHLILKRAAKRMKLTEWHNE